MQTWTPALPDDGTPIYLAIADHIGRDIRTGVLSPGDRLPPQRRLAEVLGIDFTTVSRGYAEAQARGLVSSHVGRGTFVAGATAGDAPDPRREAEIDLSMNLPPDVTDPELVARMREGLATVAANLIPLLRYQSATGTDVDREAASSWLSMRGMVPSLDRIAITPGAHATLLAILTIIAQPGDTILSEDVTYPGIRAISARLGLRLVGVPTDQEGVLPEALADAIAEHRPRAAYLNPTLNNPTTRTMTPARRQQVAQVLIANRMPCLEDDAYGFIPAHAPAPIATLAPGLVWHVGGLAKCIGAGLRLAFTVAPDARAALLLGQALRTVSVMPSPIAMALATRWIMDGTADGIRRFVRAESAARQALAADVLRGTVFDADPNAFNIWLSLPPGLSRADLLGRSTGRRIGVIASDAFTVLGTPGEKVRICLGGKVTRDALRAELLRLAGTLDPASWRG